jgi:hypothetical protein
MIERLTRSNHWHNPMDPCRRRPSIPTESTAMLMQIHGWKRAIYSKPIGMKNEPKIKEGILISGLPLPPFLSANYSQDD